jgi:hypothetical protein
VPYWRKEKVKTNSRLGVRLAEHMEEDDPTPHALPRWVELEYMVSTIPLLQASGIYHDIDLLTLDPLPPLMNPMDT